MTMREPKRPRQRITGWVNLYKPLNIGSTQAVSTLKWALRPEKIGHAGTLDPLATGVLPIALGEATKCVNLLMDAKKTYHFTVQFGQRRSTDDAEGEVVATSAYMPSAAEIQAVLPRFTGAIAQTPPAYSAIKVDGKRAYALARAGEEVTLKSRMVYVYDLALLSLSSLRKQGSQAEHTLEPAEPEALDYRLRGNDGLSVLASFRATVSKGTYIRSLGRDIAQACGAEGYIARLHRAAVGPFTDDRAISLDFFANPEHKAAIDVADATWLWPPSVALDDIPALSLTAQQVQTLRHGQHVLLPPTPDVPLAGALLDGQLVALVRIEANRLITKRMLNL